MLQRLVKLHQQAIRERAISFKGLALNTINISLVGKEHLRNALQWSRKYNCNATPLSQTTNTTPTHHSKSLRKTIIILQNRSVMLFDVISSLKTSSAYFSARWKMDHSTVSELLFISPLLGTKITKVANIWFWKSSSYSIQTKIYPAEVFLQQT